MSRSTAAQAAAAALANGPGAPAEASPRNGPPARLPRPQPGDYCAPGHASPRADGRPPITGPPTQPGTPAPREKLQQARHPAVAAPAPAPAGLRRALGRP